MRIIEVSYFYLIKFSFSNQLIGTTLNFVIIMFQFYRDEGKLTQNWSAKFILKYNLNSYILHASY